MDIKVVNNAIAYRFFVPMADNFISSFVVVHTRRHTLN
jgi:hypothetical protein